MRHLAILLALLAAGCSAAGSGGSSGAGTSTGGGPAGSSSSGSSGGGNGSGSTGTCTRWSFTGRAVALQTPNYGWTTAIGDVGSPAGDGPDGKLDLLVGGNGDTDGQITTLYGDGQGGFPLQSAFTMPAAWYRDGGVHAYAYPLGVALADLNGDTRPDLAIADNGTGRGAVLLNDGNGFSPAASYRPIALCQDGGDPYAHPFAVAVGDFDGDGKLDLAFDDTGCSPSPRVSVVTASQLASGSDLATHVPFSGDPYGMIAAGFGSGDALALADEGATGPAGIDFLEGFNGTAFSATPSLRIGAGPDALAAADFNGDGELDLAVADFSYGDGGAELFGGILPDGGIADGGQAGGGAVLLELGLGDGGFLDGGVYAFVERPTSLAVGDFNGDHRPDLVVANFDATEVGLLLWTGTGLVDGGVFETGNQPAPAAINTPGNTSPQALSTGDLNGDGISDFAIPAYAFYRDGGSASWAEVFTSRCAP